MLSPFCSVGSEIGFFIHIPEHHNGLFGLFMRL
jgi:hypothetical protein